MAHFRVCRINPCTCEVLRYAGATLIPLVVGPMEIGVGEWARVLFLKGDGWHALSDAIAQGVSFVVSMIVLRDNGISPEREGRIRRRGAFFKIVLLVGAASEVLCEAIWKFFGPADTAHFRVGFSGGESPKISGHGRSGFRLLSNGIYPLRCSNGFPQSRNGVNR